MQGFTDIHTHIIPGVDDGAECIEVSLEMLKIAWEEYEEKNGRLNAGSCIFGDGFYLLAWK